MNTTNKILLALVIGTLAFCLKLCSDNSKREASSNNQDYESYEVYARTGRINTVADGIELKRINLWSSAGSNRTVNCEVVKGQRVKILEDSDPYYLVEAIGRSNCKGYCMKGFIEE